MLSEMIRPENLELEDGDDISYSVESGIKLHSLDINSILRDEDLEEDEFLASSHFKNEKMPTFIKSDSDQTKTLKVLQNEVKIEKSVPDPISKDLQFDEIDKIRKIEHEMVKSSVELISPLRRASDLSKERGSLMLNNRALLNFSLLESVSATIEKACNRGAKRPSIVLNHSKFIIIGTENGHIVIFDHYQNVCQVISSPKCNYFHSYIH